MRSQYCASIPIPIPINVPPTIVLAFIQTYVPTLEHNPSVAGFHEIPTDPTSLDNDPHFVPWNDSVRTYQVHEITQLVPGISAQSRWPVVYQRTPDGIRARATASRTGITVWASWTIRPRVEGGSPANSESTATSSATAVGEEWELLDEIVMECHRLMMPFASSMALKAHRDITQKIVDEAAKRYFDGTHMTW
ncbi:hypothetical protein BGZ63DRAFT_457736 [Mariannaea sp. PMI_226]|nr:hypothetical protein BGZ63DRAFT_457736 [Mariannaea sp. PMI_226]